MEAARIEDEGGDTCRICSGGPEGNSPLFRPCLCRGSIGHIHQDCLATWLSHSKKRSCDVCKHPYAFTKVYARDMPRRLPALLLMRRAVRHGLGWVGLGLRAGLVAVVWLALLPWATLWTWRIYFAIGNGAAGWLAASGHRALFNLTRSNTTTSTGIGILAHPAARNVGADILSGQIIATVIVLVFIAVFLLKEWIAQNARPAVLDDAPPANPAQPAPPQQQHVDEEMDAEMDAERARIVAHMRHHEKARGQRQIARLPRRARVQDNEEPSAFTFANEKGTPAPWLGSPSSPPLPFPLAGPSISGASTSESFGRPSTTTSRINAPLRGRPRHGTRSTARSRSPNRIASRSTSSPTPTPTPTPPIAAPLMQATISAPIPSTSSQSSTATRPTAVVLPRRPPLVSSAPPSPALPSATTKSDVSPGLASYAAPEVLGEQGYFDYASEGSTPRSAGAGDVAGNGNDKGKGVDAPKGKGRFMGDREDDEKEEEERVKVWSAHDTLRDEAGGDGEDEWLAWATEDGNDKGLRTEHARYFAEPTPSSPSDDGERDEDMDGMPPLEGMRRDHDHDHDEHDHDHEDGMFGWEDDDVDIQGDDMGGEGDPDPIEPDEIGIELLPVPAPAPAPAPNAGEALFNANPLPPNALVGPLVAPGNDNDANAGFADDFPPEAEDDMDGALEAIGMRGPVHIVAQNAALMVFVLDTAIGLGVWLPFTLGKTLGLLTLNPRRALVLLHSPVRLVRVVTDPGVDGALFVVRRVMMPVVVRAVKPLVGLLTVDGTERGGWAEKAARYVGAMGASNTTSAAVPIHTPTPTSLLGSPYVHRVLSSPLVIKATSHPLYTTHLLPCTQRVWHNWTRLVTSDTPSSRASAVAIGYGAVAVGLVMWLNVFDVGSVRSAGRAVRDAVRQWVLVVKVVAFVLIELVLFPLGCGLDIDACSVWMFPGASLQTRLAFAKQNPLTSVFYHWVIGTMFMYQFAILLAGARTIMRPGAMWFIKDPSDANFHPIRDILERPALLQLRKLLFSALMYAAVLTVGIASVGAVARALLPIRWLPREPLSDIPLDLLVLHVLLPYTTRHFRPKRPLKRLAGHAWRWAAAQFGLSGYMFGVRATTEEKVQGGEWRRVPASDNVIIPRGTSATAKVDLHGAASDEAELRNIAAQNIAARRAGRDPKTDYTVVHVPTHFKVRVAVFLTMLWIAGCAAFSFALCLPLLVGRQMFALALGSERHVHDGYSLLAGFYALWAAFFVGWHAEHRYLRRLRSADEEQHAITRTQHVLRALKGATAWAGKAGYMVVMLGGVIPILLAAVIEVYCVLPMRVLLTPGGEPVRVRVVDLWALGLVYLKILARGRLIRMQAQRAAAQQQNANNAIARGAGAGEVIGAPRRERGRAIARGVANIRARGWLRPDPVRATREVIAPLMAGLLAMLLFPPLFAYSLVKVLGPRYVPIAGPLGYLQIYPLIFTGVALGQLITAGADVFVAWSRAVRDREYLVELRLRNFDQQTTTKYGAQWMDGVEERDVGADEIADDELALVARPNVE